MGSAGEVTIVDNVFLGSKSIILKDVHIGNNVIVGGGSVVTKNIPDNMVVVGNPAKVLCTLDEYYEKRKKLQLDEAIKLYKSYKIKRRGCRTKVYFMSFPGCLNIVLTVNLMCLSTIER